MNIVIEVSAGELIDKITILEIKAKQIRDPKKLANVQRELQLLASVRQNRIAGSVQLDALAAELQEVNLSLWKVEDDLRECERKKEFAAVFISLARSVYHLNDRRAALKRSINEITGSRLIEEKSYADYQAA